MSACTVSAIINKGFFMMNKAEDNNRNVITKLNSLYRTNIFN